jgi:uncharacterized membrane protein
MELIPILATIILMATISTFFLAIGAYILYKIRERQGEQVSVMQPSTIQAELITPEALAEVAPVAEHVMVHPQRVFERVPTPAPEPIFVPGRVAQSTPAPQTAPQYTPAARSGPGVVQTKPSEQKFRKYTAEGYVAPKEEKKQGAVKWR